MSSHRYGNQKAEFLASVATYRDPGDAGTLSPLDSDQYTHLVSAGAETRLMVAASTKPLGFIHKLYVLTYVGDITFTGITDKYGNTLVFTAAGQYATLEVVDDGSEGKEWTVVASSLTSLSGDVSRSDLVAETGSYSVPLTSIVTTDTVQPLGDTAGTPTGAFGIAGGTHGTASPIIQSEAASAGSITNKCRLFFVMPPEYVAAGNVTLTISCSETVGEATVETTIDVEAYETDGDGTVTGDICATAAQDVGTEVDDRVFTLTGTALSGGDVLDIEITGVSNDTGGTEGVVLEIYDVRLSFPIKG